MPKPLQAHGLGPRLRDLRRRRALTLKQVVAGSREVATDSAGRISQPYLSQLEAGQAPSVSLAKLFTLATLYGVDVRDLLADATPAQRDRLRSELETWRAEGREIPTPIDRYIPPDKRKRIDDRVDGLLARCARSVSIPLEWELSARTDIRWFVVSAAIPAYLDRADIDDRRLFWAAHLDFADRVRSQGSAGTRGVWHDIVDRFESWLFYERGTIDEVIRPVSFWTLDWATHLTGCHFSHPPDEQKYGFDRVPLALVRGVRAYQLAHRLAAAAPSATSALPPPPDLTDAPRAWLSDLVYPQAPRPIPHPAPPAVPLVLNTIRELTTRMPALTAGPQPDLDTIEAMVSFLERSGLAHPLPPQRTRRAAPKPRRLTRRPDRRASAEHLPG